MGLGVLDYVDTFAGAGGWEAGARSIGLHGLGIELDPVACATRAAAGLDTIRGDIASLEPRLIPRAPGFLSSPPCPTFSAGGKGSGRRDLPLLLDALEQLENGNDPRAALRAVAGDPRTVLTVEPLRWTLARRPEWTCWEQVPAVLPVWEACAEILRRAGYSAWTGKLNAEEYGVPQTRKRAVLIASLSREVGRPRATHQRWDGRNRRPGGPDHLPVPVPMAQALGWGMTERPYPTIASSRSTGGPDKEKVGGSGARSLIYDELGAGRWILQGGVSGEGRPRAAAHDPAPTISSKGTATWVDDPAAWYGADRATKLDARRREWPHERPATTVSGDPRIQPPGHKINEQDRTAGRTHYNGRAGTHAVRVSLEDAAVLQTFPRAYPWQGTSTQRFMQVGNAVPPLLAAAVIGEATGKAARA